MSDSVAFSHMHPVDDPKWTDAEVIEASWEDSARFRVIFERYYPQIRGYLIRRAGFEIGSEAAADTFVEAFQSRKRYDLSYPSAKPWLFGIATNLLRNHFRREATSKRLTVADDTPTSDFADDVAWRADAERLVQESGLLGAISALRQEERDVLFLYAFGDLTYEEIGDALTIPTGTVRSRLSRLRKKLRRSLRNALEGGET